MAQPIGTAPNMQQNNAPSIQQPAPNAQQSGVAPSTQPNELDYQMYVAKGLELIASKQTRDDVLALLKSDKPVEALAKTLIVIMQKLDAAARNKGTEVQDAVKIIGSNELIQELAKIGKAARIFNLDDDHIELAFSLAVQDYVKMEVQAGRIDGAKLYAKMQQNVAALPDKEKQEMDMAMQRIQATAKKYSGVQ